MREVPKCRSCGAPMAWVRTSAGKLMPVDANEDGSPRETPEGNVVITSPPGRSTPTVEVLGPLEQMVETRPRFMPHHATCPQGREWRR